MISRDMYRLLKRIPRAPKSKTYGDLLKTPFMNKLAIWSLLSNASERGLVNRAERSFSEDISNWEVWLTESGQEAIEDYFSSKKAHRLNWIAIVISVLSLLASIIMFYIQSVQ